MVKRIIVSLLLHLTPARWRESVAGDFAEEGGARGASWHAARVLARLWIEELLISRVPRPRRRDMGTFSFQLRQAVRALAKRPVYSLIIITTLAIGIGANAAVFGLASWLMFRPVPAVQEPERLVTIRFVHQKGAILTIAHPEIDAVRELVPQLASAAGSMDASFHVAPGTATPERIDGEIVSANYFDVLGVRPALGRFFSSGDPASSSAIASGRRAWEARQRSSARRSSSTAGRM